MIVWLRLVVVVALVVAAGAARAQPVVFRIATVAPEGTSWARELRRWRATSSRSPTARCASRSTSAASPATEEVVLDRIRRDQLDGAIGSELCTGWRLP